MAPSGVAVWNSPTVDAKRHAIYFGTGDSATEPAPETSDSILAVDMNTGKLLWHFQAEPNDATLGGCFGKNKTENCPDNPGPDWDFGASPILKTLPAGRDLLLAPNKSGIIFALDPDRKGAVVWKTDVSEKKGTRNTNLVWGGSADRQNLYVGLVTGAITAVQMATGEKLWTTQLAQPASRDLLCGGEQRDSGRGLHRRDGRQASGAFDRGRSRDSGATTPLAISPR